MMRVKSKTLLFLCFLSYPVIILSACGSAPPPSTQLSDKTIKTQGDLGAILGPVTKEKVLDRLKGYPVCGMNNEEQKLTLKVNIYPVEKKTKQSDAAQGPSIHLLEMECFFFGVQGLYEYALLTSHNGRVYPLPVQGAEQVKSKLNGDEKQSPAALNQGRSEVCGVPDFNPKVNQLKTLCKANPEGSCGAYTVYELISKSGEYFDPKTAYFQVKSAHFQSCEQPNLVSPNQWPTISLP